MYSIFLGNLIVEALVDKLLHGGFAHASGDLALMLNFELLEVGDWSKGIQVRLDVLVAHTFIEFHQQVALFLAERRFVPAHWPVREAPQVLRFLPSKFEGCEHVLVVWTIR